MDASIQKALHDKLYDKRKVGALELEKLVRDSAAAENHDKIARIIDQLCHDYAYAIHQPYARNGGLIGLAAASIALGPDVARYLEQIVPPVLACFSDQDARVRYYACESMYNISKTSKGEILPYFNEIFDALAKLAADTEPSVKNGAELLDRLIKDIVSESATSYVSVLHEEKAAAVSAEQEPSADAPIAFSLARFIPLLQERIYVQNPFTRMFLVSWITLLDSIPDLEVISYLPSFLAGLFRFLNDRNQDVVTATQHVLEKFLEEIKLVATVNRDLTESQRGRRRQRDSFAQSEKGEPKSVEREPPDRSPVDISNADAGETGDRNDEAAVSSSSSSTADEGEEVNLHGNWIPGQDVHVDYAKILEILVDFLNDASEDHLQLTALRWIDSFFEICPEEILSFVPTLLDHVLPALSNDIEQVRVAGSKVNTSLMEYIVTLTDKEERERDQAVAPNGAADAQGAVDKQPTEMSPAKAVSPSGKQNVPTDTGPTASLDYEAAVNALTTQFMNENEATRAAALSWMIMLQRKAPKKVLAAHDGTFPTLLQTLSDPSDTVVTRDLQLLSQISKHSNDSFFTFFMINLLKLFSNDRKLLETRGNLIIRQLCTTLSPERIYRIMADCIEKEEDSEFASIMVQNLNNNLITAPELADLRKKLRGWEFRDGQTLFVALFRAWCHNSVATISLCLLGQAYEQAYNLLQIFADVEMTVAILIQIDKLVQLLESPVFTYLRLQLLEPAQYPFLYKTLYGILMLLPQSAAFAALKNRLNSVSAIGYLHTPGASVSSSSTASTVSRMMNPSGKLKSKDDSNVVKWNELLEKFKTTQDRSQRSSSSSALISNGGQSGNTSRPGSPGLHRKLQQRLSINTDVGGGRASSAASGAQVAAVAGGGGAYDASSSGAVSAAAAGRSSSYSAAQAQSQGAAANNNTGATKDRESKRSFGQGHLHLGRFAKGAGGKSKK